jgi:hypothetical protein
MPMRFMYLYRQRSNARSVSIRSHGHGASTNEWMPGDRDAAGSPGLAPRLATASVPEVDGVEMPSVAAASSPEA